MQDNQTDERPSLIRKIRRQLFGKPRDLEDRSIFHKLALIPILAWIGLGADGLSSSSYGPEEAFRNLGSHTYLAILLAPAMALTVFIISYAYSRIIEHFPHGGGGYIVATHMLGKKAGVISGCALLVDYMLTITVSIVSCTDALFSFLPVHYHVIQDGHFGGVNPVPHGAQSPGDQGIYHGAGAHFPALYLDAPGSIGVWHRQPYGPGPGFHGRVSRQLEG